MLVASNQVEFSGSISGTTLNVSSVTSGEISIGQTIYNNAITKGTTVVSGNGSTWQINNSQITSEAIINGGIFNPGTVGTFSQCFNGTPTNSESTEDSRSSVQINGVPQTPPRDSNSSGQWTWLVEAGSTIEYNFNVSVGDE